MGLKINEYISEQQQLIEEEIIKHLQKLRVPLQLKESMLYSFTAGGKRIRPILLLASYQAFRQDIDKVLTTAVALEMIHTYSLIHDDLPAMDDDDLRRGEPTNHKVFDEATAILAGDALLTYSFEVISNDPLLTDIEKVHLIKLLSQASGPKGMVAGQILDMESENCAVTLEKLEEIHALKTGELLTFAISAGAYLGHATEEQLSNLNEYSYYLGLIFQVQDDILDVTGDQSKLGKPVGSDIDNQKSTYPSLLGLQGAIKQKDLYVRKAKAALLKANIDESHLNLLTDYLTQRDH